MCLIMSFCRVCEATEKLQNLFVAENDFLITMLRRIADIELSEDDPLPKHICFYCSSRLRNAYDFKMQCEATDRRFRKEISSAAAEQMNEEIVIKEEIQEWEDGIEEIIIEEYLEDEDIIDEIEFKIENYTAANLLEETDSNKSFEIQAEEVAEKLIGSTHDDPLANSNDKESQKEDKGNDEEISEKEPEHQLNPKETHSETLTTNHEENAHQTTVIKKRFQCNICQKDFRKKYGLNVHMGIHQGLKYPCAHCDRQYSNETNLNRHIRAFHEKVRNFACEICDQRFARGAELQQHNSVHISERNYSCDRCDKKFKSEFYLRVHQNRHDGIRPASKQRKGSKKLYKYPCNICGKILSACGYYTHMRSHRGERPFKCPQCEMTFVSKAHMERHQITHTSDKPFKCDLCAAAFRSGYSQRMHRLTHQDAKRFLCDFCGDAFSQKASLKSHVGIAHTGEKPFACTVCNERFSDRMRLRNHRKGHSKEERVNARRTLHFRIINASR